MGASFFAGNTCDVARSLIGAILRVGSCAGAIVEVEAYRADAASHAVTRPRQGAMLKDTYGRIYVYLIYGMHHCLNITTEREGVGAVLIRAVEPLEGLTQMRLRRGCDKLLNLTNGPGKLCQAFGIDRSYHGEMVGQRLSIHPPQRPFPVSQGPRIGIRKATELPWRYFVPGNRFVSR
ncbi:MAG: DNA-3-methyladenine glycosylase [Deltaproteobacteria bacterium]|nr:DNA-3-methyladenine glycosylase [Deltaproteobacteria bacterium]